MKTKDIKELRELLLPDLIKNINQLRLDINQLSLKRYSKPKKNVREIKILKKKLAVMLTIARFKELKNEK